MQAAPLQRPEPASAGADGRRAGARCASRTLHRRRTRATCAPLHEPSCPLNARPMHPQWLPGAVREHPSWCRLKTGLSGGALGEAGGPSFSPDRALRLSSRLRCSDRATVPRLLDSGSRRSPRQVSGRASSSRHATPCSGRASRALSSSDRRPHHGPLRQARQAARFPASADRNPSDPADGRLGAAASPQAARLALGLPEGRQALVRRCTSRLPPPGSPEVRRGLGPSLFGRSPPGHSHFRSGLARLAPTEALLIHHRIS